MDTWGLGVEETRLVEIRVGHGEPVRWPLLLGVLGNRVAQASMLDSWRDLLYGVAIVRERAPCLPGGQHAREQYEIRHTTLSILVLTLHPFPGHVGLRTARLRSGCRRSSAARWHCRLVARRRRCFRGKGKTIAWFTIAMVDGRSPLSHLPGLQPAPQNSSDSSGICRPAATERLGRGSQSGRELAATGLRFQS